MHILFIDDHKDSADAFGEIASGLGHKVQVAYDGRSAMALTQTQSFDVVFFDIELPDADGRELCRQVRNEGASRDACVIASMVALFTSRSRIGTATTSPARRLSQADRRDRKVMP